MTDNMQNVNVGDIFTAEWGYDETRVSFFQILEKVGKKSVRVREVQPEMVGYNRFKINHGKILPPSKYGSVFIKDNEKGDIKRLRFDFDQPSINLSKYVWARKETRGVVVDDYSY